MWKKLPYILEYLCSVKGNHRIFPLQKVSVQTTGWSLGPYTQDLGHLRKIISLDKPFFSC